jgi:Ca2+-transporting ATPase
MLERIIVSGAFIAVVFMAQSWTNFMGGTAEQQSTILFTLFVVFQLFNAFNSRELGNASLFANLLRNKVMIGVFALMFALQVLVVQFGGAMFRTVPLPIDMWLKIIAVGFGVVVLQEVIKTVKRAAAAIRARRTANESDSQQPHQPIALDLVD